MTRVTAKEISDRLASQIDTVVRHLLPNGKKVGHEWCVGSAAGEAGHSCKIQIDGDRAGLWADFAGNDSGDALDLWAKSKNISLSEAMIEAKRWLGMAEPVIREKTYERPDTSNVTKLKTGGPVLKYLKVARKLSPESIAAYRVTQDKKGAGYYLPSFSPAGKLANLKWIGLKRREGGKKKVVTGKNCAPCLFGWQAIPRSSRSLMICEGEIDAISWHQMGFPALSVPYGCKNKEWIEIDWENLEPYDEIYLSFDMDEAGRSAIKEIVNRLGMHRCKVVSLPRKDMNEWLVKDDPDESDLGQVLASAEVFQPAQFVDIGKYAASIRSILDNSDDLGMRCRLFEGQLTFRAGETTIWTGYPGHGKSTIISQVVVEAAAQGFKVAIASMEMPLHRQLAIMARQFYATDKVDDEKLMQFLAWAADKIYPLDVYGMITPAALIELMEYAAKRHGCVMGVVDSLMKLDLGSDDYDEQRKVVNNFTQFAAANNLHLHIVAHPRKGTKDTAALNMLDVKGAQDVIAQPDNVLIVQRNKKKSKQTSMGRSVEGEDARIICDKQRATGNIFEQRIKWWPAALQYTPDKEIETPKDWSQYANEEA